jgi:hypothetical protein
MKVYIVYVDGIKMMTLKAASFNAAEKKAQAKFPGKQVSVEYTEVLDRLSSITALLSHT